MDSQGILIAQVYTSEAQIPVENAVVTVTTPQENESELLAYRVTDSSGKTKKVTLPAPPMEDSLNPQNERKPFSSYFLRIDHPEFEPILVKDVQVFANQMTIQPAELIPLEEARKRAENREVVNITPQNL